MADIQIFADYIEDSAIRQIEHISNYSLMKDELKGVLTQHLVL